MIDDGYAAKTRADRLVTIKQAFKRAARQKLIETNPLDGVKVADPPPTRQLCFEPEQVQTLIDGAADDLERTIFAALAYTGMRFGELRDLRWADLSLPADRPGNILICHGGSGDTPKDQDSRRVPLHAELRKLLDRLPRLGDRVFYSPPCKRHPEGGRPLSESTWLKRLKAASARCDLAQPQQYKLHTFRHAFASMCARNNVAYRYALAWMGHSSSEIVDLYFKQFDSAADAAITTINYQTNTPQTGVPAAESTGSVSSSRQPH